jgi:hypothetical protein
LKHLPRSLDATAVGYGLAANLPELLTAAILLLTPLAFLFSTARNSRQLADRLALALAWPCFLSWRCCIPASISCSAASRRGHWPKGVHRWLARA